MATLVLLQNGQATPYNVGAGETIIGRLPECTIQLQSNTVSRRHARIVHNDDQYLVEDLGSGNGTFLNGRQLAKGEAAPVHNGDHIKLGPMLLRFECEGAAPPPAAPAPATRHAAAKPKFGGDDFGFGEVNFADEDQDEATIMGTLTTGAGGVVGGFGGLEVRPEAKLKAIIEISRALSGETDLDRMLPLILNTLFTVFRQADRGCIMVKDFTTGQLVPRAFKHRSEGEDASVRLSRTILNKVLTDKTGILSADAANDAQFTASESISNLSIRSMMCVPMLNKENEPIGVINIDTQNPLAQFSSDDLEILMTVAGQAALTYDNARLMKSYIEKQKQDGEMRIAMDVQQALLPTTLPKVPGYSFFASYDAAQAVGGDYYDCFKLTDDLVCLSFGDVAGKGVPGALIMSRISSCVQNTMPFLHDIGQAIEKINGHMCSNMVEGRYVTYELATIDTRSHKMRLIMAGHKSPIIRKPDGSIEEFNEDAIGLPIGVIDGYPYEVVERDVNPGEQFVFFTDGVDEAMNHNGDLYGVERLHHIVKTGPANAEELGKALLADVRRHANGRPQNDDITIMVFSRDP